jgi:hypothetical protein
LAPGFSFRPIELGSQPLVFTTRTSNITVSASNDYDVTSPTFATTFMLGDVKIVGDGWVTIDFLSYTAHRNIAFGFDSADTNKTHTGASGYDRYALISGTNVLTPGTNGVNTSAVDYALSIDDIIRLRRVSGIVTLEVSSYGKPFVTLFTWPGTYTTDMFINAAFNTTALALTRPRIRGGVAK